MEACGKTFLLIFQVFLKIMADKTCSLKIFLGRGGSKGRKNMNMILDTTRNRGEDMRTRC